MRSYARDRRRNDRRAVRRIDRALVARAAVFSCLAAAALWVFFFTSLFELREVRFNGGRYIQEDSLRAVAEGYLGANIFTARTSEMRAGLLSLPEVRSVDFRRRLLHRIDCYIQERVPVALIADGDYSAVDEDGVVIPSRCGPWNVDLPIISGLSPEEDGAAEMLAKAVEVLSLLKEFDFSPAEQLSEIHVEDGDIVLVWMETGSLINVGKGGYTDKIRKFRAVYGALEEEDEFPRSIDLRFDRQVVIR